VPIGLVNSISNLGAPDVGYSPVGVSITSKQGDVLGLTTGGLIGRLNATGGGTIIAVGGGIWGIGANDFTSDASGNITAQAAPTGVAGNVPARLALGSYGQRVAPASPISGVAYGQAQYYLPSSNNYFIQRHKKGTRVNDSLCGKKCDLTWNATTLEWEVDTTSTSLNEIVVALASFQLPWYLDNKTLWDDTTFATDASGAWVVFQVVPAYNAEALGLRYATITS
jgi:hypothetical protein